MNGLRRRRWPRVAAAALMVSMAACGNDTGTEQVEIAAELRALRATLQSAAQMTQRAERPAAPDRAALVQVLAPLQEAMLALASDQRQLATRQIGLTQELQRWTQLVASQATGGTQADLQALTQRLQGLEQAMAAQETRHAEVELMLRKALDHTADQLEVFLQRIEGTVPATEPSTPGAANPVAPRKGGADDAGGAPASGSQPGNAAPDRGAGAPARGATTAWLALLLAASVTAGWLWWRRPSRTLRRRLLADENVGMDEGVQQIWAAAELLGEAVGRLRGPGDVPTGLSPAADADESIAVAGALGLDDDLPPNAVAPRSEVRQPAAPASRSSAPPTDTRPSGFGHLLPATPPTATPSTGAPQTVLFVVPLPGGDQGRALRALQQVIGGDPRVLRRPAPEVVISAGRAAVRCCLLPALPPGERSHLEQRLRDAVA